MAVNSCYLITYNLSLTRENYPTFLRQTNLNSTGVSISKNVFCERSTSYLKNIIAQDFLRMMQQEIVPRNRITTC